MLVQIFFIFTPTWGRFPILTNIFEMGWFNHQLENNDDDDDHNNNIIIPQEQLRGSLKWASVRVAQSRFTGIPGGYLVVDVVTLTRNDVCWGLAFKRQFLHTKILHIKKDCAVN